MKCLYITNDFYLTFGRKDLRRLRQRGLLIGRLAYCPDDRRCMILPLQARIADRQSEIIRIDFSPDLVRISLKIEDWTDFVQGRLSLRASLNSSVYVFSDANQIRGVNSYFV